MRNKDENKRVKRKDKKSFHLLNFRSLFESWQVKRSQSDLLCQKSLPLIDIQFITQHTTPIQQLSSIYLYSICSPKQKPAAVENALNYLVHLLKLFPLPPSISDSRFPPCSSFSFCVDRRKVRKELAGQTDELFSALEFTAFPYTTVLRMTSWIYQHFWKLNDLFPFFCLIIFTFWCLPVLLLRRRPLSWRWGGGGDRKDERNNWQD